MTPVCIGLNHRTTPVELRERVAFRESALPQATQTLRQIPGVHGGVIISTCNRVELYAAAEQPALAVEALKDYLSRYFHLSESERAALSLYEHQSQHSIKHLFEVVSGLDSMVLGETEIFGQVKKAYLTAQQNGGTEKFLNKLFQRAFTVGKLVRNSTRIQQGATSVGSVAVELAEKIFGDLKSCNLLLLGAGEMIRVAAQSLVSRGAKGAVVSNRSHDRAIELARELGGSALHFESWPSQVPTTDILLSSTSAPHFVVHPENIISSMKKRRGRPLFMIDIAVPRDIDPVVNQIEDVYLYDIDALESIAKEGRRERENQIALCNQLIEQQVVQFIADWERGHTHSLAQLKEAPGIG